MMKKSVLNLNRQRGANQERKGKHCLIDLKPLSLSGYLHGFGEISAIIVLKFSRWIRKNRIDKAVLTNLVLQLSFNTGISINATTDLLRRSDSSNEILKLECMKTTQV